MATVGARFTDLKQDEIAIGTVSYGNQGRARVQNEHAGMVNLYAQRSSSILVGAELFCPEAEHLAHLLAWAVQQQLPVNELLSMPFYHPVLEEGLRTALRDLPGRCRSRVTAAVWTSQNALAIDIASAFRNLWSRNEFDSSVVSRARAARQASARAGPWVRHGPDLYILAGPGKECGQ
ncbi:MAG: hypothetical protein R3F24_10245 [Gammaproteobacteria bacterium]